MEPGDQWAVTGEVVYVDLATADLDKLKGTLKGKIVLLGAMRPTPDITEPLFHRYTDEELKEMESFEDNGAATRRGTDVTFEQLIAERLRLSQLRTKALKMMADEGVASIITPSRDGGNGGGTGIIFDDNGANLARNAQMRENAVTIPNAVMMIEHYNRLARLVTNHVPVTVEVNIEAKFTGDHEHGFDTVAEIPGTDPKLKEQVVMVGGHLDSWISGTGATDNGAGSIMAMEAVRILKALDVHPKRTIRIALWSGEEAGLFGSLGYVKQHFGDFAKSTVPDPPGTPCVHEPQQGAAEDDQGVGDAGRLLQPRQRHGQSSRRVYAAELGHWADLQAVDCAAGRPGRFDDQLSRYRRDRSPGVRRGGSAGVPVHTGPDGLRDPDAPLGYGHVRSAAPVDLEQAAIVEAIFLWNTSQREAMMPRKPFPHPENEQKLSAPIPGIYPNAVPPPDSGKPGATQ